MGLMEEVLLNIRPEVLRLDEFYKKSVRNINCVNLAHEQRVFNEN